MGMQVMLYGEPLPPSVIEVAARTGIDPHALHDHVEGAHGFEPHNAGYDELVEDAVECLAPGAECPFAAYVEQARAKEEPIRDVEERIISNPTGPNARRDVRFTHVPTGIRTFGISWTSVEEAREKATQGMRMRLHLEALDSGARS